MDCRDYASQLAPFTTADLDFPTAAKLKWRWRTLSDYIPKIPTLVRDSNHHLTAVDELNWLSPMRRTHWFEAAIEQEQVRYLDEAVANNQEALLIGGPDARTCFILANTLLSLRRDDEALIGSNAVLALVVPYRAIPFFSISPCTTYLNPRKGHSCARAQTDKSDFIEGFRDRLFDQRNSAEVSSRSN